MPQFQGSLGPIIGSQQWARENRGQVFGSTVESVRRAFTDFGHVAPGGDPCAHARCARPR